MARCTTQRSRAFWKFEIVFTFPLVPCSIEIYEVQFCNRLQLHSSNMDFAYKHFACEKDQKRKDNQIYKDKARLAFPPP
jgi:hypothetical protein